MAISALFGVSIDELLSNEKGARPMADYLFESITEYDIDEPKRYDMKLGGAKQLVLSGYNGEKICVRLASNTLTTLQSDCKVKTRGRLRRQAFPPQRAGIPDPKRAAEVRQLSDGGAAGERSGGSGKRRRS